MTRIHPCHTCRWHTWASTTRSSTSATSWARSTWARSRSCSGAERAAGALLPAGQLWLCVQRSLVGGGPGQPKSPSVSGVLMPCLVVVLVSVVWRGSFGPTGPHWQGLVMRACQVWFGPSSGHLQPHPRPSCLRWPCTLRWPLPLLPQPLSGVPDPPPACPSPSLPRPSAPRLRPGPAAQPGSDLLVEDALARKMQQEQQQQEQSSGAR